MRNKVLFLLLSTLAITGCLRKSYMEAETALSVPEIDMDGISMDAEVLGEDNVYALTVSKDVTVNANRSWSAVIHFENPDDDWLTLSQDESLNPHQYTLQEPVGLVALRNTSTQARKATVVVSEDAENILTIPVVQKGQKRFLEATPRREKALAILDTVKVEIACNTAWAASLDESTTADVTLENASGEDYGTLNVCFGENNDAINEMEAVVNLTATGCEPVTIRIAQAKGQPYVAFRTEDNTVIPTEADSFVIHYASNTHWHMEVAQEDHFPGCMLSMTEGEPSPDGTVVLSYKHGTDPEVLKKSVTLRMWSEGVEPVTLTLTQKGCLHLDFQDFDASWHSADHPKWWYAAKWPFASPEFSTIPQSSASSLKNGTYDFETAEGYVFKIKTAGSTGIWFNLHQMGFIVGTDKNETWVEFPAIEGMKLTTIIYEPPYTGNATTTNIRDVNGNVMSGTTTVRNYEKNTESKANTTQWKAADCNGSNIVTMETSYTCTFKLTDSEYGAAYRHTLVFAGNLTIKEYTLIYE